MKIPCPICNKLLSPLGLAPHKNFKHSLDPPNMKNNGGWNKGKTISTDVRVKTNSTKAREGYVKYLAGLSHDEKLSKFNCPKINKSKMGGLRKGAGRGNSGWYKGYWCDSSWELAWVMYHIDSQIEFTRNTAPYKYIFNDRTFNFFPDFIIDGQLIEIKGYLDDKNRAKIQSVSGLKLILKEDIKPYIEYAERKYGKDFTKQYESKKVL